MANQTHDQSLTGPTGWYVIFPEGGDWVAVHVGRDGRTTAMIEGSNAETHVRASDHFAHIVQAVRDGVVDADVSPEHAARAVESSGLGLNPEQCVVERIVLAEDLDQFCCPRCGGSPFSRYVGEDLEPLESAMTESKKTQHTPGPWRVVYAKIPDWHAKIHDWHDRSQPRVIDSRGCYPLVQNVHHPGDEDPVCEANARLIAAAPDLLAACREMRACDELACTEGVVDGDRWEAALEAARAATALAEGEGGSE